MRGMLAAAFPFWGPVATQIMTFLVCGLQEAPPTLQPGP